MVREKNEGKSQNLRLSIFLGIHIDLSITTHDAEPVLDKNGVRCDWKPTVYTSRHALIMHKDSTVEDFYLQLAKLQVNSSKVVGKLFTLGSTFKTLKKQHKKGYFWQAICPFSGVIQLLYKDYIFEIK